MSTDSGAGAIDATTTGASGAAVAPSIAGSGNLRRVVSDSLVLARRSLLRIPRSPDWLIFATIQPVMFVLLFRYVFGGAIQIPGESYVNFLMAGIFVQTVAFGSIGTAIGLAEDLQKGLIDRFRSLPMARSAVIVGRVLADLALNAFVVVVMVVVGLLVGFRPEGNPALWLAAFLLLLLLSFSFSWIGAWIGLSLKSLEAVNSAGFIWLFPLTFASSAFVMTETMPGWLQTFAEVQPITVIINTVRGWLLDQPVGRDAWLSLLWLLGVLVVFVPLSIRQYERRTTR